MKIDYDDNDKTIEEIRAYIEDMKSRNVSQKVQNLLISKLIFEIVDKLHKTLIKENDELEEFIAKYNFLLAVGKITDDEKEQFRKIKRYRTNTTEYFALKSKDLINKLEEFRDDEFKEWDD